MMAFWQSQNAICFQHIYNLFNISIHLQPLCVLVNLERIPADGDVRMQQLTQLRVLDIIVTHPNNGTKSLLMQQLYDCSLPIIYSPNLLSNDQILGHFPFYKF